MHSGSVTAKDDSRQSVEGYEEEESIGDHYDRYVESEERRAEDRHKMGYGRIAAAHHGHQETEAHGEEADGGCYGVATGERDTNDANGNGGEVHAVETASHRDVSAGDPTEREDEDEKEGESQDESGAEMGGDVARARGGRRAEDGDGEKEESQRDGKHGEPTAGGEAIVETLGVEARRRGQNIAGDLMLKDNGFVEDTLQLVEVAVDDELLAIAQLLANEKEIVVGGIEREFVVLCEPRDRAGRVGDGVDFEEFAAEEHLDDVEFFACGAESFGHRARGGRHSHRCARGGRGEGILMGKEVVVGDPAVGGTQQLMDIVALDLDHRFVGPLAEIEEPSAEDLFGGQALIASVAAEFGGEVLGQSLHGADAALVEDIDAAHFVGCRAR